MIGTGKIRQAGVQMKCGYCGEMIWQYDDYVWWHREQYGKAELKPVHPGCWEKIKEKDGL